MKTESVPGMKKAAKQKHRFLRIFLRILIVLVLLTAIISAAVFIYSRYTQTHYRISFYQETSRKVCSNIRIAVVSDIHCREYETRNEALLPIFAPCLTNSLTETSGMNIPLDSELI